MNPNGKVIDLVLPVAVLLVSAVFGMLLVGYDEECKRKERDSACDNTERMSRQNRIIKNIR